MVVALGCPVPINVTVCLKATTERSGKVVHVNTYAFLPYDYREPLELGVLDKSDSSQLFQLQ